MASISPKGCMLLVKPQDMEEVDPVYKAAKSAGLHLLDMEESKIQRAGIDRGTVLKIGNLAWKDWGTGEPWCKEGDIIEYPKHSGKYTKANKHDKSDKDLLVFIRDEDVLAVIEE